MLCRTFLARFALLLLPVFVLSGCRAHRDAPPPSPSVSVPQNVPPTYGPPERGDLDRTLHVGGRDRSYLLHVPPSYNARPVPLVLALHGGGGEARSMAGLTGLSRLADREGFIAAYPQGVQNSWNHGRNDDEIAAQRLKVDDVAFLRAVVDAVASAYAIDPARVFVTGISNGGFMAFRLACEAADRFAAIAPVVATLGEEISKGCSPSRPVPVVMFNGADDPLVPYGGGSVHVGRQERGRIRSVDDTVAFWAKNNGCANELFSDEPDRDPGDGVTIVKRLQTGCTANADVLLYTMKGGGHAWPGGPQYLPIATVGRATKDIDATEIIWSFFKDHPRTR